MHYVEKAYAKRHGTYNNIDGGMGRWALTELSGGIATSTNLDWNAPGTQELFAWLYDHQDEVNIININCSVYFTVGYHHERHQPRGEPRS